MVRVARLIVQVCTDGDLGDEKVAVLTDRLGSELLELDILTVVPMDEEDLPHGAKGLGQAVGSLAVHLGWDQIQAVISLIQKWAARNNRVVEVSCDGDSLKVHHATLDQQEKIVNAWLERHAPRT